MTHPELDRRALEALDGLFDVPPAERAAAIAELSARDAVLAQRVMFLLAFSERGELEVWSSEDTRSQLARLLSEGRHERLGLAPGDLVGAFRLERLLGVGGMGEVWRAQRAFADFEQAVALKVLRLGLDSPELLARFREERRLLAELQHPSIPRLVDGGTCPDGRPYLAMDCVDGQPIDVWVEERALGVDAVTKLCIDVCDAVAHAHTRGIVHRDLKPTNVHVDRDGRVHVLDFGIAKVVDRLSTEGPSLTRTNQRVLTPSHASPEQVRGEAVTKATDVHALGILLFELLTGASPFCANGGSQGEVQQAVLDLIPPAPSRGLVPRLVAGHARVRGDLDIVVAMALRKEPLRRYPDAGALADDLRRFLAGQRVLGRADTTAYRVTRFVRRNRALVAGVTATILALLGGLIAARVEARRARAASEESERAAYVATLDALEASLRAGSTASIRTQLLEFPVHRRGWEWEHLMYRVTGYESVLDYRWPAQRLGAAVVWGGKDDPWLAMRDSDAISLTQGFDPIARILVDHPAALARNDVDGSVFVLDGRRTLTRHAVTEGGHSACRPLGTLFAPEGVVPNALAVAPNGHYGVTTLSNGEVVFFDVAGQELTRFAVHEPSEMCGPIAWSPDGTLVATGGWDETIQLFDGVGLRHLGGLHAHTMGVNGVAFSPSSKRLASVSYDRHLLIWDIARGSIVARRKFEWILETTMFVDEERLLVSDTSSAIRLHSARTCDELEVFHGARAAVDSLALSPDRSRFVGADLKFGATVFLLESRRLPSVRVCEFSRGLTIAPDDSAVLTGSPDEHARVWSLPDLDGGGVLPLRGGYVMNVAWSPDGRTFATSHYTAGFALWRATDRSLLRRFEIPAGEAALDVTIDVGSGLLHGVTGALTEPRTTLRAWSLDDAVLPPTRLDFEGRLGTWHQNTHLVSDSRGAPIAVLVADTAWRFRGAAPPARLQVPGDLSPSAIGRGRNDREVLLAREGLVAVIDVTNGELLRTFPLLPGIVVTLDSRPQGDRVAVGRGPTIDLLDAADGRRVVTLHGHGDHLHRVLWTHNGEALVSMGYEGDLKVWRTK